MHANQKNRATSLIEEFMVAANGVIARTFEDAGVASIRRIVRTPKRWDRIVEVANGLGTTLPAEPDSKSLNDFLLLQKQKDPDHFPDLSLTVIKLMGPGEYVLVKPKEVSPGHFGLAVQDYTHSTAPNRRFPDVVTQRLMKAFLAKANQPYSEGDLNAIAQRCTLMEDAARKVEREMEKRIAAVVLHPRIGQTLPGNCYRRKQLRNICAHARSARGRNAGECWETRFKDRARCRRSRDRQAGIHRSRTRIHRLRHLENFERVGKEKRLSLPLLLRPAIERPLVLGAFQPIGIDLRVLAWFLFGCLEIIVNVHRRIIRFLLDVRFINPQAADPPHNAPRCKQRCWR